MKGTYKVLAIISIVIGSFAILGGLIDITDNGFWYAFIGGGMFLAQGIISLNLIKEAEVKK